MPKGFFDDASWGHRREPLPLVPECGKCGLDQHCNSPKMKVSGNGRKKILIIAEAPGEMEDKRGIQLCGNSGGKLLTMLHQLGINMRKDCYLENALMCRPIDSEGNNRMPTSKEVKYCQPHLSKTLDILKPEIVIPLGKVALQSLIPLIWKDGEVDQSQTNKGSISRWVGWQIPCQTLNAWVCPTYHPSFLLHGESSHESERRNDAAELLVMDHLRSALKLKGRPWPKGVPDFKSKVTILFDDKEAADKINLFTAFQNPIAFDYETTTLKPHGPHARILSCSVSDGKTTIAFPWFGKAIEAMKILLGSKIPKIGGNMAFEHNWTREKLGINIKNWIWDTLLGAHWANPRGGIVSVKFQSFVLLGAKDYDSHVDPYKRSKSDGGNDPNRMHELDINDLLLYNGLDSLYEFMIAKKQMEKTTWATSLLPDRT